MARVRTGVRGVCTHAHECMRTHTFAHSLTLCSALHAIECYSRLDRPTPAAPAQPNRPSQAGRALKALVSDISFLVGAAQTFACLFYHKHK